VNWLGYLSHGSRSFGRLSKYKLTIDVRTVKTGNGLEIGLKMSKGRVMMIGKFPGYTRFKGIAKEF
jgi:hypothetical protein